jgi:hypothetical protein
MRLYLIFSLLLIVMSSASGSHHPGASSVVRKLQDDDDSLLWKMAGQFVRTFDDGNTSSMNEMLPGNFIFQWMHQNSFGKKSLLTMMADTAVVTGFRFVLRQNGQTVINYSDDRMAANVDASIEFLDRRLLQSMSKESGYGLCIMYFEKRSKRWVLQTVHLDVHCSLCNL